MGSFISNLSLELSTTMRGLFVAIAVIISVASCEATLSRDAQWEEFKLTFKKGYRNLEQESERKAIFMAHLDAIETHNAKFEAGLSTYKQGINQFSDITFDEFQNTVLMREQSEVPAKSKLNKISSQPKSHPDSHDWRYVMGAIKNHGDCDGGWVDDAFDTIMQKGGDCTEADYPYHATNGYTCKSFSPVVNIAGYNFVDVYYDGVDTLSESVYNNGPHAVYVYANEAFQRYNSGIFDDYACSTSSYNHAVINVGYDKTEGYWLIRNSWSTSWGESGYMRMARGKNTCNIEHYAWVPYL